MTQMPRSSKEPTEKGDYVWGVYTTMTITGLAVHLQFSTVFLCFTKALNTQAWGMHCGFRSKDIVSKDKHVSLPRGSSGHQQLASDQNWEKV